MTVGCAGSRVLAFLPGSHTKVHFPRIGLPPPLPYDTTSQRNRELLDELKAAEGYRWKVSVPQALFGDCSLLSDCAVQVVPGTHWFALMLVLHSVVVVALCVLIFVGERHPGLVSCLLLRVLGSG